MKLRERLLWIQSQLKAPKNHRNTFGQYNYRSQEDILEALKPLLNEQGATLVIGDDIVEVGGRVYVKAVVTLAHENETISATAYAREPQTKKGMDEAQITGSTSSYARKYALNGMFLIDDTKDPDTRDNREEGQPKKPEPTIEQILKAFNNAKDVDALEEKYAKSQTFEQFKNNESIEEAYKGNLEKLKKETNE